MSFVATPESCVLYGNAEPKPLRFYRELVGVDFVTTEEFVKSVLPPGFEPADKPVGNISVSTWTSNRYGCFDLGMVTLQCKHKGVEGGFMLTIVIDQDMGAFYGREVWGEVKKCGKSQLNRSGYTRSGFTKRGNVKLIEFEAEFGNEVDGEITSTKAFEVKAFPNAIGDGLMAEPHVVSFATQDHNIKVATGKGKVTLRGTRSDPLHTLPLVSIGDFSYVTGPTCWEVVSELPLGYKDEYWPYYVGRHYDAPEPDEVEEQQLNQVQTLSSS